MQVVSAKCKGRQYLRGASFVGLRVREVQPRMHRGAYGCFYSVTNFATTCLLGQLGGGEDEVSSHGEADNKEASPGEKALRAELVALAGLGPRVGGVDGRVPIDVGAVLVLEPVHAQALALAALRILPALGLHGVGHAHEVLLHSGVLDLVQALLLKVNLLAGGHHGAVHGSAAAGCLDLQGGAQEGLGLCNGSHRGKRVDG
mmetsp:Transcript_22215/g.61644  ORF Transcript_22215/g.61644 Transcript_22215/m.61644 type:complete len:202 (-) Transcript_22215:98-703(-)